MKARARLAYVDPALIQNVLGGQPLPFIAGVVQTRVAGQPASDEGQRLTTQHVLDQCRVDVGHAVAKACVGAGHAVMQFVRVQHQRVARYAVAQRTLVVEALHTGQRAADRIGIVAMRVVAVATEPGFDTLDTARLGTTDDPVGRR